MIRCDHISLSFKGRAIIKDLSFLVHRGEKVCLSGVSGRGKSTLLRLLLGILSPDHGRIAINGKELSENTISEIRRSIAWVPQNVNIPVSDGLELMQMLHLTHKRECFSFFLSQLGLPPSIIYENFSKVSGGEKQRIILALCMSMERPILLLDEPTSSLDQKSIQKLIALISTLKETTVVSASHHPLWIDNSDSVIEI